MDTEMNILLIEDDAVDAEAVMRMLRSKDPSVWQHHRYNVVWKSSLSEAVHARPEGPFHLLLLDMGLPDGDKDTSIETLRQVFRDAPIVVLTGTNDQQVALESLRRGAEDYLIKGNVTRVELLRCLAYSIERFQLRATLEETANTLAKQKEVLQAVIDNMSDGVVVTDGAGHVSLCNPAARHMLHGAKIRDAPAHPEGSSEGHPEGHSADSGTEVGAVADLLSSVSFASKEAGGVDATYQEIISIVGDEEEEGARFLSVTAKPFNGNGSPHNGYVAVLHDITRHKKVEQLKDEFISIVSHELKTPLTSLNGSLGLMLAGAAGELPVQAGRLLDVACRNCERLITLINDLLDVQQIELGQLKVQLQPLDLASVVCRSVELNDVLARSHQVSVVFTNQAHGATGVDGDEARLFQVMDNLLSNAIKFSPVHSTISVDLKRHGPNLQVSVHNQGPIIPPETQAAIFGKFVQGDSTTRRRKGGTGLGLYITKYLVERHSGEVWIETQPGKGTTFVFTLPGVDAEPEA